MWNFMLTSDKLILLLIIIPVNSALICRKWWTGLNFPNIIFETKPVNQIHDKH